MAFAVEPYIFDWIFFDDSSELKTWRFRLIRRAATGYPQKVYIFATDIGSVYAIYLRRGLSVLLIRVRGSQGLDTG